MIQNREITHSEFEKSCKLFGYETFSDKQMEAYIQDAKSLIEKSEKEELNDIEKSQLDEFNVNCASLKQVNVVNDDLTKSLIYFRPAQVIWDKDENGEIMKSRAGTYANTPQNRKLGRVGQKFGGQKQGEEKKDGRITEEHIYKGIKKWAEGKNVAYSLKVTDISSENHNSFVIEPSYYKGDSKYDGMQINYEDGVYEVSEMQTGKDGNDIKVFLETKSLSSALNSLDRGNKQKAKSVIDMSPSKENKEGGESKPLIAHSKEDIKWEEDPNGGQFAKYKMGTINKYTEDGKTSFSVKTNKGSFNASSMEDAISKIDKESK